ncbi:hypothetical protein TNCV_339621 [Trichonephila clavipes]|nr:hypothetical protein TNCV_339621 [Trichonephila clavipes]
MKDVRTLCEILTSAEGLASTKKTVANGCHREGVGAKRRATARARKHNVSCFCTVCGTNYYDENQGGCNVVALVHPGSMRNVSS